MIWFERSTKGGRTGGFLGEDDTTSIHWQCIPIVVVSDDMLGYCSRSMQDF